MECIELIDYVNIGKRSEAAKKPFLYLIYIQLSKQNLYQKNIVN